MSVTLSRKIKESPFEVTRVLPHLFTILQLQTQFLMPECTREVFRGPWGIYNPVVGEIMCSGKQYDLRVVHKLKMVQGTVIIQIRTVQTRRSKVDKVDGVTKLSLKAHTSCNEHKNLDSSGTIMLTTFGVGRIFFHISTVLCRKI